MRYFFSAAVTAGFATVLAACTTGPSTAVPFSPPLGQAFSGATRPQSGPCPKAHCVYLALQYNFTDPGEIAIYPLTARGSHAPNAAIVGKKTQLHFPQGVAFDSNGNLYVANAKSIGIFAPGAQGNVAPSGVLQGTRTGLSRPSGIALDAAGDLYVVNNSTPSVTVYAPGSTGNVAPIRTIGGSNTQLSYPWGVALDAAGNVYVTNFSSITEYGAGASGNVAPIAVISGQASGLASGVEGIALDASANIYAASNQSDVTAGLLEFSAGSNGDVPPLRHILGYNTRMIVPMGLAVDRDDNAYVLNWGADTEYSGMLVFGSEANGDAAPERIVTGKSFTYRNVGGIAIR